MHYLGQTKINIVELKKLKLLNLLFNIGLPVFFLFKWIVLSRWQPMGLMVDYIIIDPYLASITLFDHFQGT